MDIEEDLGIQMAVAIAESRLRDDKKAGPKLSPAKARKAIKSVLKKWGYSGPYPVKLINKTAWIPKDVEAMYAIAREQDRDTGEIFDIGPCIYTRTSGLHEMTLYHELAHMIDHKGKEPIAGDDGHSVSWLKLYLKMLKTVNPGAANLIRFMTQ